VTKQPSEAEIRAALDRMLEQARETPHRTAGGRMTIPLPRFREGDE